MGQTARLNELYAEYQKYPLITKQRMFYEAMEEILPDMKIIIEKSDGTTQTMLPLESFANVENITNNPGTERTEAGGEGTNGDGNSGGDNVSGDVEE